MSEDIDYLYETLEFKQCPIEVAFMILGKKWSATILKELLRGVSQFNRLEENLEGINPRILSIRLKEFRHYGLIKRRIITENDEPIKITIPLGHGSLLLMSGELQKYWQHSVPKRKKVKDMRINLTFRIIT